MALKLIALHGYTLNAAVMRAQLAPLSASMGSAVELIYLDAPLTCAMDSVTRLYGGQPPTQAPPYLTWWDADDDGATYRGWERTRELLADALASASSGGRVGVLGFSQGAMVAATAAALACRGELPALDIVIAIAGAVPRARELAPYFATPIDVPSLHVWGLRDQVSGTSAPALAERFGSTTRAIVTWRGPHVIPTHGPAADAIVETARRYA